MNENNEMARKIVYIRKYLRLSQQRLAMLLGIHARTVAGWEAGTS